MLENAKCFKCNSTKDLSLKTKYLHICRACRNEQAKSYKLRRNSTKVTHDLEEWNKKAKASRSRILSRLG